MSKGGESTTTSEQRTNLPPWLSAAQQNLAGLGFNMNQPFMGTPLYQLMGLNVDQQKAFDLARGTAEQTFEQGRPTLTDGGLAPFMNPFLQNVIDPAMSRLQQQNRETQAQIGARAAAAGAFGGSREALQRGMADRTTADQVATMVPTLMAQGFDNAQRAAVAESGLMDADQRRQLGAIGALLGVGDQQQAFGQRALDVPWTTLQRMAAVTPMNQFNTAQMGTQTQPDMSPSPFMQILGMGSQLLGSYLSDRDAKTNIQKLGKDPDTGLDIFAYDYKADVEAARKNGAPLPAKRVGPMAQDVEKAYPGSTKRIGGNLAILMG